MFARKPMPDPTDNLDTGDALAAILRAELADKIEAAFVDAAGLGLDVAFALDNPFVQDVLDELAKEVVGIVETTRDEIRALVGRQAAEGWNIEQLADAIEQHGITRTESRAAAIARTESARAYSLGSIAAYTVSGQVGGLEWLTAEDERTCPTCAPLNGRQVNLGSAFDGAIRFPPAHTNCRCALRPVLT